MKEHNYIELCSAITSRHSIKQWYFTLPPESPQSISINTLWLSQSLTLYTLQQKSKQEFPTFRTIHPGPHWSSAVCSRPVPTFVVDLPTPHDQNSPHESHPWWNPQRPRRNDPRHWPSNQLLPPTAVRDAQRYSLWTLVQHIMLQYASPNRSISDNLFVHGTCWGRPPRSHIIVRTLKQKTSRLWL